MNLKPSKLSVSFRPELKARAEVLYRQHQRDIYVSTDRMFAVLMVVQWAACIVAAYWLSPRTWIGAMSQTHLHVWMALLLGGAVTITPVAFVLTLPGETITRHVIALAQMVMSGLLIHVTGGRIETHFHVFGSLAFLAFYRDWRVLITATVVVASDHLLRGLFWPQSVYGVEWAAGVFWAPIWRTMEHAGWVVFEDIILVRWCLVGNREMREIAARTAELETTNERIEKTVVERTAELAASEERSRTILDLSSDAFIAINRDGQIVAWNNKAESTFGHSRDEAIGRLLEDIIVPPKHREAHRAGIQRYLATGEGPILNQRLELTAINCQGQEFPVELAVSAIRIRSEVLFSAFVRDISARKQADMELQHAKETAELASKAKSDFLANMSHEIRTPLNGIVGMTELALDTELTAGQREYLNTVKLSSDALLTVINDILDFSKIEAGKLHMDCLPFDLTNLIGDACKPLGLRAHQKGLELACRIPAEVPQHLMGDPGRLRQVLVNLAGNAIKFTDKGEVVVEVELSAKTDHDVMLHFTVRDTGIGIATEKQSQIFRAFEQADNSTTRNYGGTGLGLAIVARLVALMKGKVWVESTVGHGSAFHFTARFELDTSPPAPQRRSIPVQNLRVLVVDDNDTNRRILEEVLRNWGMLPTVVAGGEEALAEMERAVIRQQPFSLVLLDAQMPKMDGFMLAEEIKANSKLPSPVLMMLSSAAQFEDAQRCRQLGVEAYLTKPIKQSELLDVILLQLNPDPTPLPISSNEANSSGGASAEKPKRHILLAEDNRVNQRVAVGILEKHGHSVNAVENGAEALQAVRMEQFDLVLMDLQMPEMDGFAATAAIRELEKSTGRHLPIVAMTARAMKGDRECCLAAGMDDYISKPVNPKELLATVERLTASRSTEVQNQSINQQMPASIEPPPLRDLIKPTQHRDNVQHDDSQIIDFVSLMERVEDDVTLLEEMIGLYLETSPRLLSEIESGVRLGDAQIVQRAAHALKGALQNLSAGAGSEAALNLEKMARSGELTGSEQMLVELKDELQRLQTALNDWSKEACV